MNEEVRLVAQHSAVRAHAAAAFVDAPALAGGVARPCERDRAAVGRRGAEMAGLGLAKNHRRAEVLELHPVEDVLAGRKPLNQYLGGEVGLGQHVHVGGVLGVLEAFVVDHATSARDGRSARAHTTAESPLTSPDCTPCVITGLSAARLGIGLAIPPAVAKPAAADVLRNRRRETGSRSRIFIGPSRLLSRMCDRGFMHFCRIQSHMKFVNP
jgi:hypothetical protein